MNPWADQNEITIFSAYPTWALWPIRVLSAISFIFILVGSITIGEHIGPVLTKDYSDIVRSLECFVYGFLIFLLITFFLINSMEKLSSHVEAEFFSRKELISRYDYLKDDVIIPYYKARKFAEKGVEIYRQELLYKTKHKSFEIASMEAWNIADQNVRMMKTGEYLFFMGRIINTLGIKSLDVILPNLRKVFHKNIPH